MAAFFAEHDMTEKGREVYMEMALNGYAIIDSDGNIRRDINPAELKGKSIAIVGNHSAGLTQSLLAAVNTPQTVAQVGANYLDSLKDEQRKEQELLVKETKMDITMPIVPLEYTMYDTAPKSKTKRYGNNKKHKKRRK